MAIMIKLMQVGPAARSSYPAEGKRVGFAVNHIKWVMPVAPPAHPDPAIAFASSALSLTDGYDVQVVETVDDVITMISRLAGC